MNPPPKETKVPHLSPSGFKTFQSNKEEYYLRYLAPSRAPRFPQTKPMSIGSAFDAFAKAYLYERLVADGNPKYTAEALFEDQVEEHNRDWAKDHGTWLFNYYLKSGAMADLLQEMAGGIGAPRFEFKLKGEVRGTFGSVVLLGLPDIFFVNREGASVILDFKINGYCSKTAKSPEKGFIKLRDDKQNFGAHKEAMPTSDRGMKINIRAPLELVNKQWALQCAIYAWLLGEDIGARTIVGIEQVVSKPTGEKYPYCRIASHRAICTPSWQVELFKELCEAWEIINSDHFFRDLSFEDSERKCRRLDEQAQALNGDPEKKETWLAQITR